MSSSDTGNSGQKRQRVSRACDLCRRKKIKCDGGTPICGNCQAFNLECSYKDMTKKRGPPKGYIEAVESRLHKLEAFLRDMAKNDDSDKCKELLDELNSPLETASGQIINNRPVRRIKDNEPGNSSSSSNKQQQQQQHQLSSMSPKESPMSLSQICFSESTMASNSSNASTPGSPGDSSTGQLTMEENGQVRYLGKSSGYYLVQKSRAYQNGAFHFSGWGHKFSTCERTPVRKSLDPYELPPKDLSRHLLNKYFEYFYPSLPLFYKKRLTSSLNSPLEPISPLLLNAIYAVASRISPDVRTRSDPAAPDTAGEIFFERARSLLDDYYDVPRISTVQALLLLAIHQHGTMKYARGWLYSGMAFRMALDLGLHRNCDHWNVPPDERERRKRVFWCCFIMDRLTSAIYGRSASFEERDCDVPFPSEDDDDDNDGGDDTTEKQPKVLETFVQFIKICDILGHVLRNVYYAKARHQESAQHLEHVLTKLNRELTHWYNGLPPSLQYRLPDTEYGETGRAPPLAVAQIYMVYYTTVILLHRPFIPGPGHAASGSPASLPSYKICISAANSILDIVNVMLAEQQLGHVFNFAVYCVFTAGIVFIKMAASDDAAKAFDAKVYINKIMRALDEIEVTWMNAARCCNILGELAGLREINLECDEYVPQRNSKSDHQQQPAIAVPNSPDHEDDSTDPQDFQERTAPDMDPFAAPNMVRNLHQQPYDPLHTAFWGVPPSLDIHEWNHYLNNTTTTTTATTTTTTTDQTDDEHDNASRPTISSTHPLIPSHEFSPMHPLRTPLINQFQFTHQRVSRDNPLTSMSLDIPSDNSVLLGLLTQSNDNHTPQEQDQEGS